MRFGNKLAIVKCNERFKKQTKPSRNILKLEIPLLKVINFKSPVKDRVRSQIRKYGFRFKDFQSNDFQSNQEGFGG